jgi:hypothetical protein
MPALAIYARIPRFRELVTIPVAIDYGPRFIQDAVDQAHAEEQLVHGKFTLIRRVRMSSPFCDDTQVKYMAQIIGDLCQADEEKLFFL